MWQRQGFFSGVSRRKARTLPPCYLHGDKNPMALLCQDTRGSGALSCFHWVLPLSLLLSPLPYGASSFYTQYNLILTTSSGVSHRPSCLLHAFYIGRFLRCADFPKLIPVFSLRALSSVLQGSADGYNQGYFHVIYFIDFFFCDIFHFLPSV